MAHRPVAASAIHRSTSLPTCKDDAHAHPARESSTVSEATFERAAGIFRAAGDVARLKLLERMRTGEWCVSELSAAAGVGMSTVSQQLRLLRSERLVTRRRDGKHVYYRLADAHIAKLLRDAIEHASEDHADHDDDDDESEES
ncbi:MAG: metalloregulator ArsR/SmtB family transcription factor [Polyangiaceae bacterium]